MKNCVSISSLLKLSRNEDVGMSDSVEVVGSMHRRA